MEIMKKSYEGPGFLVNSGPFNGLDAMTEGREKIVHHLINKKLAEQVIKYKLRDWIFSRQRYWGEPIPLFIA